MQDSDRRSSFVEADGDDMPSNFLCAVDEITDPGSRGFDLALSGDGQGLFVVRHDNRVFAYRNSCPHTGAPLDWSPDQFLDPDGALIQCAMHGALFSIETGECLHGPCVGASLEPLSVCIIDGQVHLADPADSAELPAARDRR